MNRFKTFLIKKYSTTMNSIFKYSKSSFRMDKTKSFTTSGSVCVVGKTNLQLWSATSVPSVIFDNEWGSAFRTWGTVFNRLLRGWYTERGPAGLQRSLLGGSSCLVGGGQYPWCVYIVRWGSAYDKQQPLRETYILANRHMTRPRDPTINSANTHTHTH